MALRCIFFTTLNVFENTHIWGKQLGFLLVGPSSHAQTNDALVNDLQAKHSKDKGRHPVIVS
jgi:hypothetical protein